MARKQLSKDLPEAEDGRLILEVTHNGDGGEGSLREALNFTQKNEGKYEISFRRPSVALRGDGINPDPLGIGYWTIQLKTLLPNIYRSDIKINSSSGTQITLVPANFNPPAQGTPSPGSLQAGNQRFAERGGSASMLVVGDVRHVGAQAGRATAQPCAFALIIWLHRSVKDQLNEHETVAADSASEQIDLSKRACSIEDKPVAFAVT